MNDQAYSIIAHTNIIKSLSYSIISYTYSMNEHAYSNIAHTNFIKSLTYSMNYQDYSIIIHANSRTANANFILSYGSFIKSLIRFEKDVTAISDYTCQSDPLITKKFNGRGRRFEVDHLYYDVPNL